MAHAPVNLPAVSFKLSLTRPAGADATAQLRHLNTPPSESRQHVFQLRQFDLQLSFAGSSVLGEDVEDELRAVDHSDIDYFFDIALLRGGEVVVKQNQIGRHGGYRCCNLRQLPASDQRRRVRTVTVLQEVADNFGARTSSKSLEFVERFFGGK